MQGVIFIIILYKSIGAYRAVNLIKKTALNSMTQLKVNENSLQC